MAEERETIERFWAACDKGEWDVFAGLLAEDVIYRAPKSRERVRGREAVVRFNREFPGDWHLAVEDLVAGEGRAVSRIRFEMVGETGTDTGISFFTFTEDGLISEIEDYWPDPYERPASRAHLSELY
ncbi:nuclear transport factor 2 family protein [Streptomyces sp. A7024]|uniref:Nuclear transport factor 2 family protein n=1 Tax=Streptomyces coryli TaxID=1128680 RepID=A0A6G4U4F0_9ACTN|nr:nuclear transport factor 2 family protein [Streptomyces coryli]NGN67115.1 nuclear transport factor 2 family protein [Streptomyces coryli]